MSVTSNHSFLIQYSGDIQLSDTFLGLSNSASPGQQEIKDFNTGANTIQPPVAGLSTVTGVLIIPPAANTQTLILKGNSGDIGVTIAKTEPTYIALGNANSFVINASGIVAGVRFIWL